MEELSIFASDAHVRVSAPRAELLAGLRALWRGCGQPLVASAFDARIAIDDASTGGFALRLEAGHGLAAHAAHADTERDVTPLVESLLYRVIHAPRPGQVLLHGSCVERRGRALVMLGPSGAGKSSLAFAALQRGYRYFTDELTLSDGERVWGVARAVQFEPVLPESALPARLAATDRALYRVNLAVPEPNAIASVPVRVPEPSELAPAPVAASAACIVRLEHGAQDTLAKLDALQTLAELHEAAFRPPAIDLGAFTGPARGYRLTWRDPERALDLLEAALRGRASMWP